MSTKKFDKYRLYVESVQAPEVDAEFFAKVYKEHRKIKPKVLREDFCGTFSVCCEWVKLGSNFVAQGVDLDSEPLEWGRQNHLTKLTQSQKNRVSIHQMNVLDPKIPRADVIAAQNFSFFLFKKRQQLKDYFQNCQKSLNSNGILIADCFGGSACLEPNEEETVYKTHSYFWDQDSYDPVTSEALFYIHFKLAGQKKMERVFTYDWRLWSIPEIREIMLEAGFSKVFVYWEGTKKNGEGDGNFRIVEKGEVCESWIAYIVGLK